jgi:sulfate/thiosulfate transport system substrate-binding protein
VYKNVPVLDRAARGATNTFVQRRIGDVLINWENEILLSQNELDAAGVEVVIPEVSILAETVVAWSTRTSTARAPAQWRRPIWSILYSDEGQDIAGKHYYRPSNPAVFAKYKASIRKSNCSPSAMCSAAGPEANRMHFADGGEFDRIYQP